MNFSYCFLLALAYFDLSYVDSFSAFSISCVQRLEAGAPLICNPHGVTHFTSDVYADVLSHKSHDSKMFEDVRSHLQHMQHMQHIQHVQCTQLYLNCHMSLYFDVSICFDWALLCRRLCHTSNVLFLVEPRKSAAGPWRSGFSSLKTPVALHATCALTG